MKKLLFALATLAIVACENKPKIQETTSDLNLPEYNFLAQKSLKCHQMATFLQHRIWCII